MTQCPAQSHNVWPVTISVSAFKSSFIALFDTDLVYFIYVLRVNVREKNLREKASKNCTAFEMHLNINPSVAFRVNLRTMILSGC